MFFNLIFLIKYIHTTFYSYTHDFNVYIPFYDKYHVSSQKLNKQNYPFLNLFIIGNRVSQKFQKVFGKNVFKNCEYFHKYWLKQFIWMYIESKDVQHFVNILSPIPCININTHVYFIHTYSYVQFCLSTLITNTKICSYFFILKILELNIYIYFKDLCTYMHMYIYHIYKYINASRKIYINK